MPKKRPIIESGLRAPEVKPSFPRFADGYIPGAAAKGARSSLEQLARGLEQFNRGVTPFLAGLTEKKLERERAEGAVLRRTQQDLPEDASKALRQGYNLAAAEADASDLSAEINVQVAALRAKGQNPSPEQFRTMSEAGLAAAIENLPVEQRDNGQFMDEFTGSFAAYTRGEMANISRAYDKTQATDTIRKRNATLVHDVIKDIKDPAADVVFTVANINESNQLLIGQKYDADLIMNGTVDALLTAAAKYEENGLTPDQAEEIVNLVGNLNVKAGLVKDTDKVNDLATTRLAIRQMEDYEKERVAEERIENARVAVMDVHSQYLDATIRNPQRTMPNRWWIDRENEAYIAGGTDAQKQVRALRDAGIQKRKTKLAQSDPVVVKSFQHDLIYRLVSQEEAYERLRLISPQLTANDESRFLGYVQSMNEISNRSSDALDRATSDMKAYYMGGDRRPGTSDQEIRDFDNATFLFNERLEESGYLDPERTSEEILEIVRGAQDYVKSNIDNLGRKTSAMDKGTVDTRTNFGTVSPITPIEFNMAELEMRRLGDDGWTGRDLTPEVRRIMQDSGFEPFGRPAKEVRAWRDHQDTLFKEAEAEVDIPVVEPVAAVDTETPDLLPVESPTDFAEDREARLAALRKASIKGD